MSDEGTNKELSLTMLVLGLVFWAALSQVHSVTGPHRWRQPQAWVQADLYSWYWFFQPGSSSHSITQNSPNNLLKIVYFLKPLRQYCTLKINFIFISLTVGHSKHVSSYQFRIELTYMISSVSLRKMNTIQFFFFFN